MVTSWAVGELPCLSVVHREDVGVAVGAQYVRCVSSAFTQVCTEFCFGFVANVVIFGFFLRM